MPGKWDAVAHQHIVERVLLALCDEMTKLIDDPDLANSMGPALLKLSNALADFRTRDGRNGTLILTAAQGVLDPLSR